MRELFIFTRERGIIKFMKSDEFKMDLQLFAEEDKKEEEKTTETGATETGASGENKKAEETKSYSEDEVQKMLQSEADRRVTQALKKAQEEWEEKLAEKERLAKLSAEEREKELERQKAEELAKKEKELQQKELRLQTIGLMEELEMPLAFVDFVMSSDYESTHKRAKDLKTLFLAEVQKAVQGEKETLLKGKTPPYLGEDKKEKKEPQPEMDKALQKAKETGDIKDLLRLKFAGKEL
jgi:hypothetical protein